MTTITARLPAALSDRLNNATGLIYSRQGREVDIALGGIPFRLATSSDVPQSIETIPVRKDQFDTENDPGEQSLSGYWRRSQSSWHEGAGNLYQENGEKLIDSATFFDSSGMDVFTPGRMTLLKKMNSWTAPAGASRMMTFVAGGVTGATVVAGGVLHKSPTVNGTFTSLHAPAGKTIVDGFISADQFYDVASDGTLYEGTVSSPGTATSWPCGGAPTRLKWGKHRLWVIGGRSLWQPDLTLAAGAAQNPKFTHPNKGWTYTCMADGASAMLFGGHDGTTSTIQSIVFDSGGGMPSLSGASITAVLPDGELIQELAVLAGQYVGIGTSRGFRLGVIGTNGQINYGPLIIEPPSVTACTGICTQGRFFVVSFNTGGDALAYRVDTGTDLGGGLFPYAKDISCGITASITSLVAATSAQLICTTSNGAGWYQSLTDFVSSGWLQTGRIRYRTAEFKQLKSLGIDIEPLAGTITIDLIQDNNGILAVGTASAQGEVIQDRYAINLDRLKYASLKFTLLPNTAATAAPVIASYQLRALPAVPPQRLITLPLLCFDKEQSRSGQQYGGKGFANDRLTALQLLEDRAETVTYQDFSSVGGGGRSVVIESMRFIQTSPAPPHKAGGAGGIIILQLRTVDV